jgi:hypothetical protein
LNILVFETKFIIEPKRSFSDLKILGLNSYALLLLIKSWNIKKFWFCSTIFGKNRNVLLLQKKSWNTSKSFGFVKKIFGINRNVPL